MIRITTYGAFWMELGFFLPPFVSFDYRTLESDMGEATAVNYKFIRHKKIFIPNFFLTGCLAHLDVPYLVNRQAWMDVKAG